MQTKAAGREFTLPAQLSSGWRRDRGHGTVCQSELHANGQAVRARIGIEAARTELVAEAVGLRLVEDHALLGQLLLETGVEGEHVGALGDLVPIPLRPGFDGDASCGRRRTCLLCGKQMKPS